MQSESTAHLVGTRFASEELEDDDGTESEIEGLSDDSEDVTAPAESLDDDDCSDNWDGEDTVGEWQDWRCKQVIEKMPGVSPLCNACKHLFGEYQPFDARYGRVYKGDGGMMMDPLWLRFLATLQALQFSAWSGCAFCKLVSAIIRRESLKFEPAETIEIKFRVRQRSGILTFTYMGRISPRSKAIRSDSKWLNILPRINTVKDDMSIHEVLPNTYSTNNLELIASWVARCSSGHSICTPQSSTGFFRPTRLLDTCSSDDMSTITLVESSELRSLRSRSRYLALSHCWGGNDPVVLTSINKDSFKSGIHLSELPKTFQHAVALARFVHVRYLRIDSLCIIQDSYTDWESEATTMKDVYRHAFFTIAATGAETFDDGLYFHRDVDLVRAVTLAISWQGLPSGIYTICEFELTIENIVYAPLNKRAWVVQERLLSLRTLHFGREQIAWECQTLRACETFPGEQPRACGDFSDVNLRFRLQYDVMNLARKTWPLIAQTYAGCHLTKETDKCIAISGIVEEISMATKDLYLAGLWKGSFVPQLCWIVNHLENQQRRRTPMRPLMYRAPSWSWLSIDSNVEFRRDDDVSESEILFEVLRVEIENTGLTRFGSIRGGFLIGRGVLKAAMWTNLTNDLTTRLLIDGQYIKNGKFWGHFNSSQVTMDLGHQEGCDSAWCLPLLNIDCTGSALMKICVIGLILVPTDRADQEYKRIGAFQFVEEMAENFLEEWATATHQVITIV